MLQQPKRKNLGKRREEEEEENEEETKAISRAASPDGRQPKIHLGHPPGHTGRRGTQKSDTVLHIFLSLRLKTFSFESS